MSEHHMRFPKCAHCGKAIFPSWRVAQRSARDLTRIAGKAHGIAPYWSKECRAVHVGHSTEGAYKRARHSA